MAITRMYTVATGICMVETQQCTEGARCTKERVTVVAGSNTTVPDECGVNWMLHTRSLHGYTRSLHDLTTELTSFYPDRSKIGI